MMLLMVVVVGSVCVCAQWCLCAGQRTILGVGHCLPCWLQHGLFGIFCLVKAWGFSRLCLPSGITGLYCFVGALCGSWKLYSGLCAYVASTSHFTHWALFPDLSERSFFFFFFKWSWNSQYLSNIKLSNHHESLPHLQIILIHTHTQLRSVNRYLCVNIWNTFQIALDMFHFVLFLSFASVCLSLFLSVSEWMGSLISLERMQSVPMWIQPKFLLNEVPFVMPHYGVLANSPNRLIFKVNWQKQAHSGLLWYGLLRKS